MLLTEKQISDLTGYVRVNYQIRWLRERGWPFEIGGDGRPKVLVSVAESKLGGRIAEEPEIVYDETA